MDSSYSSTAFNIAKERILEYNLRRRSSEVFPGYLDLSHLGLTFEDLKPIFNNDELMQILQTVTFLNLSNNNLDKIPDMSALVNLRTLNLSDNNLDEIPGCMQNLHNLQSLCLDCNKIEYIPNCILNIPNLQYLGLEYNKIKCIPDGIQVALKERSICCDIQRNPLSKEVLNDFFNHFEATFRALPTSTESVPPPAPRKLVSPDPLPESRPSWLSGQLNRNPVSRPEDSLPPFPNDTFISKQRSDVDPEDPELIKYWDNFNPEEPGRHTDSPRPVPIPSWPSRGLASNPVFSPPASLPPFPNHTRTPSSREPSWLLPPLNPSIQRNLLPEESKGNLYPGQHSAVVPKTTLNPGQGASRKDKFAPLSLGI
jgi:Leucine-rich repeat (LRR) protein